MHDWVQLTKFERHFDGVVRRPSDAGYNGARRIWNGAVQTRPAAILEPRNARAVGSCLDFANREALGVTVKAGGYDWAGRCVREGALVIDMSAMAAVKVDVAAGVAHAGGGAIGATAMEAATAAGYAIAAGTIGSVGIAGLTLGGGYGPLMPRFGLAVDNLSGVEVVLANGRVIHANAESEPDLFWAIRGGGGNFGVVTALDLKLLPVQQVIAGKALYPWRIAKDVLQVFSERLSAAPDGLAATLALIVAPNGAPAVAIAPCWSGEQNEGSAIISALTGGGHPIAMTIEAVPLPSLFSLFEANAVPGRHYVQQTRWLPELNEGAITALLAAAEARTSPLSAIVIQSFHGAPTRVPVESTAFPVRQSHFLVGFVAAWEEKDNESMDAHRRWAVIASEALAPYALPGGYANLLGPDDQHQIQAGFAAKAERLKAAKQRFDPNRVFSATGPNF
jgi:FAD/FMN-containing dehydrogenase